MTDLTKLSDSDLKAVARGDLRFVSAAGLRMLSGQESKPEKPDYESVLNQGSTLRIGPIDTGVNISPGVTQFLAGMGKRFTDIGTLGLRDETEADKALMSKTPAMVGGAVGDVATMLGGGTALRGAGLLANMPKVAAAGRAMVTPANLPQAAGVGALYSGLTTQGDTGDRLQAGAIGGAAGAALPVVAAGWQTGKALVEPLTKKGQEAIAGRTLRRFAGENVDDVMSKLQNPEVFVPGSVPSAAEASGNAGIAALQQGLSNVDKGGFGNALDAAQKANRAARVSALQDIAKDAPTREAAIKARDDAAEALYGKAFSSDNMRIDLARQSRDAAVPFSGAGLAVPSLEMPSAGLNMLAKRPAFKSAMEDAKVSLANSGLDDVPLNSLQGLHRIKLSLDEALNGNMQGSALSRYSKSDLKEIKSKLLEEIHKVSPTYEAARSTYADMSKPIAQMDVGQELINKLQPAMADFGGNTRETAATYTKALRDSDLTARRVTGFNGATLENTMSPEQMSVITGVAKDLARKASADDLARGLGSNTAQNLATQNILRQAFGPLGIPQSFAESAFMNTAMKPLNLIYQGVGEGRIADSLGQAMLDPQQAARLMALRSAAPRQNGLLNVLPAIPAAVVGPQFSQ